MAKVIVNIFINYSQSLPISLTWRPSGAATNPSWRQEQFSIHLLLLQDHPVPAIAAAQPVTYFNPLPLRGDYPLLV